MKRAIIIGGLLFIATLAACEQRTNTGYHNAKGDYLEADSPHDMKEARSAMSGGNDNVGSQYQRYMRRGYYTYDGYYIAQDSGISVDETMFPPRGMCRMWFANIIAAEQPDIDSCDGITKRVPKGAYVIYGG